MGGLARRVSYEKALDKQLNRQVPILELDAGHMFADDRNGSDRLSMALQSDERAGQSDQHQPDPWLTPTKSVRQLQPDIALRVRDAALAQAPIGTPAQGGQSTALSRRLPLLDVVL